MDNKQQIHDFIQALLIEEQQDVQISDEDSLVISGLLNSMAILKIVMFLEAEFDADLMGEDFDQEQFDSVNLIHALIS